MLHKSDHGVQERTEEKQSSETELKTKITESEEKLQAEKTGRKKQVESQEKTNPKEQDIRFAGLSSNPGLVVVEINRWDRYIRLINTSTKEQQLGGWMLQIRVIDREPTFMHTFEDSLKIRPGQTVTMRGSASRNHYTPTDLVWTDLKALEFGDRLQVALISNTREIQYYSVR